MRFPGFHPFCRHPPYQLAKVKLVCPGAKYLGGSGGCKDGKAKRLRCVFLDLQEFAVKGRHLWVGQRAVMFDGFAVRAAGKIVAQMVLLGGRVFPKIELARPRVAKDQLYPALYLLGGLMLVPPDRLQNFQHIFCCKL